MGEKRSIDLTDVGGKDFHVCDCVQGGSDEKHPVNSTGDRHDKAPRNVQTHSSGCGRSRIYIA